MRMSTYWIDDNLYSEYLVPDSPWNKGKTKYSELDESTQKRVKRFYEEMLHCINFLYDAEMLSPDKYEDLLSDGLDSEKEYLEGEDVGFQNMIEYLHDENVDLDVDLEELFCDTMII